MQENGWPLLLQPEELEQRLAAERLLVVDLSRAATHEQFHIPGAVFLDYRHIVAARPPAGGLLPDEAHLSEVLCAIGMTPHTHVVAYDDEGGGKAARLLWTLDVLGHGAYSLLDGGLHAWANEGHRLTREPSRPPAGDYVARLAGDAPALASTDHILAHLEDPHYAFLDARSPLEYAGVKRFSARGGHIPGAVNMEWTEAMDAQRNLRLREADALRSRLEALGIEADRTVVAYCQTHHRSAHTWFVLKWLGYAAKGYAGSWSEWGNREDTPVETGER